MRTRTRSKVVSCAMRVLNESRFSVSISESSNGSVSLVTSLMFVDYCVVVVVDDVYDIMWWCPVSELPCLR